MQYRHLRERYVEIEHGKIKRTGKFEYLGKWIQLNGLDKQASKGRVRKRQRREECLLDLVYKLTQSRYNKRAIPYKAKILHYNSVIKPEGLKASECLILNKNGKLQELEKKKRKILRKILGPQRLLMGFGRKGKNINSTCTLKGSRT